MKRTVIIVVVVVIGLGVGVFAPGASAAQPRAGLQGLPGDMTPAEVQQLFDAFELVRAQEMLDLTDAQYPQFVAKLKGVQDVRREAQQQRMRMLRELQQLANQDGVDDAELQESLDSLKALEHATAEARTSAYDDLDSVLTVRQRARFRMFEQAMERRRLDLLMRARRSPSRRPGAQTR